MADPEKKEPEFPGPKEMYANIVSLRNAETGLRMNRSNASIALNAPAFVLMAYRWTTTVPSTKEASAYVILSLYAALANGIWYLLVQRSTKVIHEYDLELLGIEKDPKFQAKARVYSNPWYQHARALPFSFEKVWWWYSISVTVIWATWSFYAIWHVVTFVRPQ